MLPSGEVRSFSEAVDGPDIMNIVRVNLGTLGIIARVTFRVVDLFSLHAIDEKRGMEATLDGVEDLVLGNDYVELFWFPFNRQAWIKRWNRVTDAATPVLKGRVAREPGPASIAIGTRLLDVLTVWPRATPVIDRLLFRFITSGEMVGPASTVFHYQPHVMKVVDLGCALPVDPRFAIVKEAWKLAMRRVEEGAALGQFPQNMTVHARFIRGSDALLSPSGGYGLTCCIEILTYARTPHYQEHFHTVYRDWMGMGGRPHWGKLLFDPVMIRGAYGERMETFDRFRRQVDPQNMFLNGFLKELFAP